MIAADAPRPQSIDSAQPSSRLAWVDTARGIGILLVVFGHSLGGIIDTPAGSHLTGFRYLFLAIYTFHMPLFFLLSGLFVQSRLERDQRAFAVGVVRSVFYPYFLWSIVQFSMIYFAGSMVNRPVGQYWPAIWSLPWRTISQFWFLWALFVLHACALLIVPRRGVIFFLVCAIAAKIVLPMLPLPQMIRITAARAPYYAIGLALGPVGIRAFLFNWPHYVRLALIPLAAVLAITATCFAIVANCGEGFIRIDSPSLAALAGHWTVTPTALLGTAALLIIADALPGKRLEWLHFLGRSTMAIFVLHILFIAGTRIVLTKAGLHLHALPLLGVLAGIGIVGPLIAVTLARRMGIAKWIGLE